MGRGRNVLKSMLHGIEAGFRFLPALFGLSLRDPSRVRGVGTLAGASWENGLPLELEIVEHSDGFLIEFLTRLTASVTNENQIEMLS